MCPWILRENLPKSTKVVGNPRKSLKLKEKIYPQKSMELLKNPTKMTEKIL